MYERQKGPDSFWAPYLNIMPEVTFFCEWSFDALLAVQDPTLLKDAEAFREHLFLSWMQF